MCGRRAGYDQVLDLARDIGVLAEILLRCFAALAESQLAEAEERAHLLQNVAIDAEVHDVALAADAAVLAAEEDVELRRAERRRYLVFHDLRAHAVSDGVRPLPQR